MRLSSDASLIYFHVFVSDEFARNIVFFQGVGELFPAGRSRCHRSFTREIVDQIDDVCLW